jgi:hypothetical protein
MTATINVFNLPKVLTLTLGGNTGASLMNYPVNRTDFTLVKGVTSEILFFVKDTDRHPVTANSLAALGITDMRMIIRGTGQYDEVLWLGNTTSVAVNYSTTYEQTTITYSNNYVYSSNVTTITSNTIVDGNTNVDNGTITNTITTTLLLSSGRGEYTVDNSVTDFSVEVWGPGGQATLSPMTGAGGGAYALKYFNNVTDGDTFEYYIGNSTAPESQTFWGNSSTFTSAIFGAYGGAFTANNVIDVGANIASPFGDYDIGYYGDVPNTGNTIGRASAWSGGNASTNPAGMNVSSYEGGGASNATVGTSPGGGAPATHPEDTDTTTVFGGSGQIRIVAYGTSNATANSGSETSNSNVFSNSVTITNTSTDSTTIYTSTVNYDPSVLIPAPGIDPAKGAWLLRLKASDIVDWPLGFLRYSVVCDRAAGDQVMLYTDRNYGPYGGLEVIPGPFPKPPEAIHIANSTFVAYNVGQSKTVYCGALKGAAQVNNISGMHSVVVQMDNFQGLVAPQASLEAQPSTNDADWFTVTTIDSSSLTAGGTIDSGTGAVFYTNAVTGPAYIAFQGNFMWVRFKIYSDSGSFIYVDYRND